MYKITTGTQQQKYNCQNASHNSPATTHQNSHSNNQCMAPLINSALLTKLIQMPNRNFSRPSPLHPYQRKLSSHSSHVLMSTVNPPYNPTTQYISDKYTLAILYPSILQNQSLPSPELYSVIYSHL